MSAPTPLWKTYLVFLAPMMLSNILQALFGTLNNVYLGQMIGVNALAAVSAFFPVLFLFIAFIIGLGAGATVLIGQAYGARDLLKVRTVAGAAFSVALIGGLVIAVFGGLFARPMMVALATPPDIIEDAILYARIMMMIMPATYAFILATSIVRGVGDTVTPLIALGVSTMIGLLVTPALIQGWLGLPRLGVASAAVASLVSSTCTIVWYGLYLRGRKHAMAPDIVFLRGMKVDPRLLLTIVRLGMPSAVQIAAMALAEVVLLGLVNGFGADATAAYGAVNQVLSYVQFPAISIAITASIFSAQAIGRGDVDRLHLITRTGLMLNIVLTGSLVVLAYLLSRTIMSAFITNPPVIDLAQRLLHVVLWSSVAFGLSGVFSGVMRASGTVFVPMALSIFAIAAVEVPVALVLSRTIGLKGVWVAYPVTFCTMFVLQAGYYLLVWRKRPIERLV
ncbi:MATE family efflux transporter [Bradyrhizobium sp. U87765 SZCCT0131]|uniref:MATE family efflux transporter n=1 Tax=unclassified Bradyrhizobium TaxID=2631580 RepID=UPI001BA8FB44|nr:MULTISPECIES: MATE family efflux transporter [unclassified Bradyrhizobium]MBR1216892.1 MATE family efflux transporter [Bradyrhizobium sp. U87765 SZCCT0131]MBR1259352.1 MATE family efflux transporter [Bradyrhizobium sp. U87765 SZCCT0134]MBR1305493.1 MATE family efflux transporter [Bradyrhizobium sp. U87765 SZCCT0110]MBR1321860.1 MATE family efflux transporter [Bradyrhizobium sp. U87765 SZCCT0109]MBR1350862.1 MATE family efflux transporter [Bradyrhizobium sp. U87765 SZCCT0048]